MLRFKIGNRYIGKPEPVFVIAEAGVNHNGDIRLAKRMVSIAKEVGADAIKFQSFKTENIITKSCPSAKYHVKAIGNKKSWFELLKSLELTEKQQKELFDYCRNKGIMFLSTPYDEQSADFLNKLGVKAFKIASTDLNNIPFLKHIAKFNKPILLSSGMSTLDEIKESIDVIKKEKNNKIVVLQCTSNYPPLARDVNLNVLDTFKNKFNLPVGYSDHLTSSRAAVASVAKGICVYEAHITLSRKLFGPDQKSSLEPKQLRQIISDIRFTEKLLGSDNKEVTPSEKETRLKMRKSIVALTNISKGQRITKDKIGIKRPGTGLAPKYFFSLIGRIAKRNISKDNLIQLRDLT